MKISREAERKVQTRRAWIEGMAVMLTTIICYMAFWRLSPGITFLIGCVSLVGLVWFLWLAGKSAKETDECPKIPK